MSSILLELARGKDKEPRRVRTQAGAERFGEPIGTIITEDMIEKAHKGKSAPKSSDAPDTPTKPDSSSSTGEVEAPPKPNLSVSKPTLTGDKKFEVNGTSYSVPSSFSLYASKGLTYAIHGSEIHAFNRYGEVSMPDQVRTALLAKYANQQEQPASKEDGSKSDKSLSELAVGSVVYNESGQPEWRKVGDDTWVSIDYGFKVNTEDLDISYKSGRYSAQDAAGFASRDDDERREQLSDALKSATSMEDFEEAMKLMPPRVTITLDDGTKFEKVSDGEFRVNGQSPAHAGAFAPLKRKIIQALADKDVFDKPSPVEEAVSSLQGDAVEDASDDTPKRIEDSRDFERSSVGSIEDGDTGYLVAPAGEMYAFEKTGAGVEVTVPGVPIPIIIATASLGDIAVYKRKINDSDTED